MELVPCKHPKRLMHIDGRIQAIIEAIAPRFVEDAMFALDGKLFRVGSWCSHGLLHVDVFNAATLKGIVVIEYNKDQRPPQAFHS